MKKLMKLLWIGAIVSVAFACGIFFSSEWDKKRFTDSLPPPPVVEEIVDGHIHPHPHEHPAAAVESGPSAEENTVAVSTEQITEENTAPVGAESQKVEASQSGTAWQNDDEHKHQHQPAQDPFASRKNLIEDMDPDELADMTHAGLLQQFGDIPEVHTFAALQRKRLKNQPLTLDEHIAFTRAQYHLWPDPRTKKTLEIFLEKKANERRTQ
ncbi:MAG: hypothetical protein OXU51_21450 [Candidatus Poribacteria bacterium]|nr:hypothetical protein [Candidatus Poribacteria bacterium]